jgi:hypothetical protein
MVVERTAALNQQPCTASDITSLENGPTRHAA